MIHNILKKSAYIILYIGNALIIQKLFHVLFANIEPENKLAQLGILIMYPICWGILTGFTTYYIRRRN